MHLTQNDEGGELRRGDVRYVLMRPDVIMGIQEHLKSMNGDFLAAFEASAFCFAQASFRQYRENAIFGEADFLLASCHVAAELGWGLWSVELTNPDAERIVQVINSPFGQGGGPSDRPVCSPIVGILRAIALVGYSEAMRVTEISCIAQGAANCRFEISRA